MSLKDLERYHFDRLAKRAGVSMLPTAPFEMTQVLNVMLDPEIPVEVATQTALVGSMDAWQQAQMQVYELGPKLLQLFDQTEMGSLKGSMLKLPKPLYLHLEGSPVLITRERDDVELPLTGLYVVEAGAYWVISMIAYGEPRDTALSFLWPQADWIKSQARFEVFLENYFGQEVKQQSAQVYRGALKIIAHTLLYLLSEKAELRPVDHLERQRLRKDLRRLKGRRLDPIIEALAQYTPATVTRIFPSAEQTPSASREGTLVKGHWNYYWVGQGRTRLEPRWIMPHWRRGTSELEEA